jgi:hypothetical protein
MLLGFVQLDFTHAVGPDAGSYVVAPDVAGGRPRPVGEELPGQAPVIAQWLGDRPTASTDVLVVGVDADEPASAGFSRRRRQGRRAAHPVQRGAVPITVVTHVRATAPFMDAGSAQVALARWRTDKVEQDRLVQSALVVINRAVHAHRVATGDPYTIEVTHEDAQAIRVGYGTGDELRRREWTDAYTLDGRRPRLGAGARDSVPVHVAGVLGGGTRLLDSEDLLLRALLDRAHGRVRPAALQVCAALELLLAELRERGRVEAETALAVQTAAGERLRQAALDGRLDAVVLLLDPLVAAVEQALSVGREGAT